MHTWRSRPTRLLSPGVGQDGLHYQEGAREWCALPGGGPDELEWSTLPGGGRDELEWSVLPGGGVTSMI